MRQPGFAGCAFGLWCRPPRAPELTGRLFGMPHKSDHHSVPATREPITLLSVDRAMFELRRGRLVAVAAAEGASALVMAAEGATPETLAELARLAASAPQMAITGRRAQVLGFSEVAAAVAMLSFADPLTTDDVERVANPLEVVALPLRGVAAATDAPAHGCASAAVGLAKVARLLPAVVLADIANPAADDLAEWAMRHGIYVLDAGDLFQYEYTAARSLRLVSEARVPLAGAEDCRILAFRPLLGGLEHLAIVIGNPDPGRPVLTRLHSECFTGDLLGSLRCDCGDQLRGAIAEIGKSGSGVLLYLAQEGRGIGLVNKLRAYTLQDRGFDTVDANLQLGFDADERVYLPAAQMLLALGYDKVRLLTNNPVKVEELARHGVTVVERVPHAFPSNRHNERYLKTKATRSGHIM
jgi:GTP cyclohydrolase II